jgi:translocation and assembly module TamB
MISAVPVRWPARVARVVKLTFVSLALVFFVALTVLLWAFQTGRAVEVARDRIITQLRERCGVEAEFDALKLGVFPPEVHLSKMIVQQSNGQELLSVDEAILDLAVFPLFYGRVQLKRVALLAPEATIELANGKIANLPRCLEPSTAAPTPGPAPASVPIALGVSDLQIERARFRLMQAGQLDAVLEEIGVTLRPGSSGGSDLAIGVDQGTITLRDKTLPLKRLRVLAHIAGPLVRPRAISVERLDLAISDLVLATSGAVDLIGPVYEARVDLESPLAFVRQVVDDLPEISGDLKLQAQITGTAVRPRATGRLSIRGGQFERYKSGDEVHIDFRADQNRVDIPSLEVHLADGLVSGTAELLFNDRTSFRADIDCASVSLARVLDAVGVTHAWVDYKGTGKVTAEGQVSPFKLGGKVDVDIRDFHVFDRGWDRPEVRDAEGAIDPSLVMLALGPANVSGPWSADAKGIWLRGVSIHRGTSTGTATARLNFENEDGLNIDAHFPNLDFADVGAIAGVHFEGSGPFHGIVRGPYFDIGGKGRFRLASAAIGTLPLGDISGDVDWKGTSLIFPAVQGKLLSSPYKGNARVDFEPRLNLTLVGSVEGGRFEDLLVPFAADPADWGHPTGNMSGTFELTGPVHELTGPIEGLFGDIKVIDEHAERARVVGRMEKGALVFEDIQVQKHGARIYASGRVDPRSGGIDGRVRTERFRLQSIDALRASTELLDGELDIHGEVTGNVKGASGQLVAELTHAKAGSLPIGGGRLVGKIRGATMEVTGALLDDALDVSGEVEIKSGLPYRGTLRLSDYDAARLVGLLRGEATWTGMADGRAELSGKLVEWRDSSGTIFLEHGGFDDGRGVRLELVGAAKLDLARGIVETKRLVLGGPDTRMQVSGRVGSELMDLKVQGRTDLAILEKIYTPIERSGGVLAINAVIRRNKQDLDLVGTGRVERGIIQWRGLPSRFSSIAANLTFSQATVLIDRAEARYGEGRITASGQVLLEGMKPATVAIEAELAEVRPQFVYSKFDVSAVFSGKLFLEGKPERLLLRGEVSAERAVFRPKFDWRAVISDPAQRLAPSVYDPSKEVLHFDIAMRFDPDDPLRLRNDTAQVDLAGDLVLTGTNQRLGMFGGLTVSRGRVGFIGREYTIESGTMEFRDRYRFFPRYDLLLSARACDATISMNLVGTLDQVNTSYSSKPEMEETNIVSCLIRGVKIKDLENIRGDRGSTGLSFAGEALWRLSGVDQQVRKVLPVDQIEVTTEYSTKERVYEPRILVAKELQDGKVRLEYSSSLLKNDDQRAAVRYRITPQLTLQYGWTSSEDVTIGDHGVDLKYRWEW